jgi:Vitamin K-dependent gamma-carboxylase
MTAPGKRGKARSAATASASPASASSPLPKPTPARRGLGGAWNGLFFAARDPRLASVLRIGYGILLLINLVMWAPDLRLWFSEAGLMPLAVGREIVNEHAPTVVGWVDADWWPWLCYGVLVASAVLLTAGWHTRIQAIIVLIGLTSFQNRNYAIVDGEDTLFRLFAFYLALCPAGWAFSLDARRRKRRQITEPPPIPWGLRLFQIQMSVIYLSSAIEKSKGSEWTSGTALYYVSRLDDAFGKLPVPAFAFETLWITKLLTWSVLALEWGLPVLLWLRPTRRVAIVVAIVFHLSIEYSMNLFLFHWLMILGLLSFAEFDELRWPPWRRPVAAGA